MPGEATIETLLARAEWFRSLAADATDDGAAQALLQLAAETDDLIRAVQESANRDDKR